VRIALIGADGFVGSAIDEALANVGGHETLRVSRANYDEAKRGEYDVVVNSAMPSGRFWAKNNPHRDFVETVEKTHRLLNDWKWTRLVQISSVSARAQLDTVYGRHKAAAEALCDLAECLVVRLGPMFGPTLAKGVLIDMVDNKQVFVSGDSRYAFSPLDWVARSIVESLGETGLKEISVKESLKLIDVRNAIGSTSEFTGPVDIQELDTPYDDAPPVERVLDFLRSRQAQSNEEAV
jgi:nucleoside-diphosphate-sugar epimerase